MNTPKQLKAALNDLWATVRKAKNARAIHGAQDITKSVLKLIDPKHKPNPDILVGDFLRAHINNAFKVLAQGEISPDVQKELFVMTGTLLRLPKVPQETFVKGLLVIYERLLEVSRGVADGQAANEDILVLLGALSAFSNALKASQADAALDAASLGARGGEMGEVVRPSSVMRDVVKICIAFFTWSGGTRRSLLDLRRLAGLVVLQVSERWGLVANAWELFLSTSEGDVAVSTFSSSLRWFLDDFQQRPRGWEIPAVVRTVPDILLLHSIPTLSTRRTLLIAVGNALAGAARILQNADMRVAPSYNALAFHRRLADTVQALAGAEGGGPPAPRATAAAAAPRGAGHFSAMVSKVVWNLHMVFAHEYLVLFNEHANLVLPSFTQLITTVDYRGASAALREALLATALIPALHHLGKGEPVPAILQKSSGFLTRVLAATAAKHAATPFDHALGVFSARVLAQLPSPAQVDWQVPFFQFLSGLVAFDAPFVVARWPAVRAELRRFVTPRAPFNAATQKGAVAAARQAGWFLVALAKALAAAAAPEQCELWPDVLHFAASLLWPVAIVPAREKRAFFSILKTGLYVSDSLAACAFTAPDSRRRFFAAFACVLASDDPEIQEGVAIACTNLLRQAPVRREEGLVPNIVRRFRELLASDQCSGTLCLNAVAALAELAQFPEALGGGLAARLAETFSAALGRGCAQSCAATCEKSLLGLAHLCRPEPAAGIAGPFARVLDALEDGAAECRREAARALLEIIRFRKRQFAPAACVPEALASRVFGVLTRGAASDDLLLKIRCCNALILLPFDRLDVPTLAALAALVGVLSPSEVATHISDAPSTRVSDQLVRIYVKLVNKVSVAAIRLRAAHEADMAALLRGPGAHLVSYWELRRLELEAQNRRLLSQHARETAQRSEYSGAVPAEDDSLTKLAEEASDTQRRIERVAERIRQLTPPPG
eukprot:gnl/Chilomastix_cuspidata/4023.p1 GENE.gnl/Chilomastix_cuspidata/4023~~gnl/Chilomastix_cuspidata/4023.p1  ORF type:complete len:952 (+),score=409.80 gnl/Chilomastix_cuspidata/4023:45-2900(+)